MEPADSSLIGRDGPLVAVADAIRGDRPVVVVGEAGIGKTSLVRAAAEAAGRTLREGGGFATLSWLPYLALRRATGLAETGDPARVAALVEQAVGPDVLFVDDLQWTDAETREVVSMLVGRIAIVTAIRDGDDQSSAALEPLLARGASQVRLDGLDTAAAAALATRLRPDLSAARLERVVQLAGGNPLLIEELAIHGQSSSSLARAIVGQLATLEIHDRRALELIALARRPLDAITVGPSATRLIELGLARVAADGIEVRHSLIADAIVDQLEPEIRRDLHGRLGAIVDDPAERSRHLKAAGRPDDALEVARLALDSERDPRRRAVLLKAAAETSDAGAAAYRLDAGIQLTVVGMAIEALALLQAAPLEGDEELKGLALAALASSLANEGRHDEALEALAGWRSLPLKPGSPAVGELVATESSVLVNLGRLPESIQVVEAAIAAGGPASSGYRLLGHLAALRLYAGQTDDLGDLEASVVASLAAGDGNTAAGRSMDLYYMTLALRGGAAARAHAFAAADRLDSIGYGTRATELRAEATQAAILAGDLSGALVQADSMLEQPLGLVSRQRLGYDRGLALALLGYVDEAERTLAEVAQFATQDFDGRGNVLWCWAEACLWGGQPTRALEMARQSLEFTAFNDDELILPSLTRAWAEVELGQVPTPVAIVATFPFMAGAAPEHRALQALASGDDARAAAAFEEAAALWAGYVVPHELLCRWAAGDALLRAGGREIAVERLRAVRDAATAIGFEPLAARARRSLRLAGERSARPAAGRVGGLLTGREREVLALVERGLTNAEIARRMSLGRPTVARLLSNSMLKLGADSRAQAVVLAAEVT